MTAEEIGSENFVLMCAVAAKRYSFTELSKRNAFIAYASWAMTADAGVSIFEEKLHRTGMGFCSWKSQGIVCHRS